MPPYWFFGPKCSVGRVIVEDPAISSHTWSTVNWTTFYPNWRSGWCFNCVLCTVLFIKQPVRQKDILYFWMAQGEIINFRGIILGWYRNALLILVLVMVFFMQWLLVFFFFLFFTRKKCKCIIKSQCRWWKAPFLEKTKMPSSSEQVVNDPLLLVWEDRYPQLHHHDRQICLFLKKMLFKTILIRHMEQTSP